MISRPDAQQQYVSWPQTALKEAIACSPDMQTATADAGTINCIASAAPAHDLAEVESLQVTSADHHPPEASDVLGADLRQTGHCPAVHCRAMSFGMSPICMLPVNYAYQIGSSPIISREATATLLIRLGALQGEQGQAHSRCTSWLRQIAGCPMGQQTASWVMHSHLYAPRLP